MEREKPVNWNDRKFTMEEVTNVLLDLISDDPRGHVDALEFMAKHEFKVIPNREQALTFLKGLHHGH